MRPLDELLPSPSEWKRALIVPVLASLGYTSLVFWYSTQPSSNVSITGPFWQFLGLYSFFAFGTLGVPILLWMRYRIRGPSILMALILLFWHVLVYHPPVGSGEGDSPGFTFVFIFVPFYLVAYGLLAGGEYWLRGQNNSMPTHNR